MVSLIKHLDDNKLYSFTFLVGINLQDCLVCNAGCYSVRSMISQWFVLILDNGSFNFEGHVGYSIQFSTHHLIVVKPQDYFETLQKSALRDT